MRGFRAIALGFGVFPFLLAAQAAGPGDDAERTLNRQTVVKFFELPIGHERGALYSEDGLKQLIASDLFSGVTQSWKGKEAIRVNTDFNIDMFPGWKWINTHVWSTSDPGFFWVEADGEGVHSVAAGADTVTFGSHYAVSLALKHGKITHLREFSCRKLEPFKQDPAPASWGQDEATRRAGNALVAQFFALPFGDERAAVYAEDAVKEILGTEKRWTGRAALKIDEGQSKTDFPGWKWDSVKIFDTQSSTTFWVEAHGGGMRVLAPGADATAYGGRFLFTVETKNGKIYRIREFNLDHLEAFGKPPAVYSR